MAHLTYANRLAVILISMSNLAEAQYLKVSNEGVALPDNANLGTTASDWACTYDTERKLIWEVKTTDKGLRDKEWKYTWFDSGKPSGEQGSEGTSSSSDKCYNGVRCDTEKFTQEINQQGLCGAKDWRLPAIEELKSLVRCADLPLLEPALRCEEDYPTPTIDAAYFPNTPNGTTDAVAWYYSSTPYIDDPKLAVWNTNFADGASSIVGRYNKGSIRAVRNGSPFANAASYNDKTGRLSLSAVQVGGAVYSAELQDKGGYQFQLIQATVLANNQTLQLPTYDENNNLLIIPYLSVLNKRYQIHLHHQNGIFAVTQANLW